MMLFLLVYPVVCHEDFAVPTLFPAAMKTQKVPLHGHIQQGRLQAFAVKFCCSFSPIWAIMEKDSPDNKQKESIRMREYDGAS
ncbi:MAG: hypothetical protein ACI4MJ_03630 [Aristaeellaceae bacterium]